MIVRGILIDSPWQGLWNHTIICANIDHVGRRRVQSTRIIGGQSGLRDLLVASDDLVAS